MKFLVSRKKLIFPIFSGLILVFFVFSNIALASEINKDNIINLVNQSRSKNGFQELLENENLNGAAKSKALDMIKNNYFSHNSPSGITPWYWFEQNEYNYKYAGENLALGFSTVENQHQAWMDSPTHKKNILNPNYKEIGVAVERGKINDKVVTIAVQMFGSRIGNAGNIEKNIPDEKSQELLEKHKKDGEGIVLKTEDTNSSDKYNNLFGDRKSEPKITPQEFIRYFKVNSAFGDYIRFFSITILFFCFTFNLLTIFVLLFHRLVVQMKNNKDMFTLVHGLIALILVGSIIF